MTDMLSRRVSRLEEDADAVQDTVTKLLTVTAQMSRQVNRLVENGTAQRGRLGQIEIGIESLREGQRSHEERLHSMETLLAELGVDNGTVHEHLTEVEAKLNRLLALLTPQGGEITDDLES